jgi:hypothetical protein
MTEYCGIGAEISGPYRYLLWREWRDLASPCPRDHWWWWDAYDGAGHQLGGPLSVVFVMLNPSTADSRLDDPTIRRCVDFAKRWQYQRIDVVNLFAYRATRPQVILGMDHTVDIVGPRNQDFVERALDQAGLIVCAWGNHGTHLGQDQTMMGWIQGASNLPLMCLGRTRSGQPKHPLYVPAEKKLERFA